MRLGPPSADLCCTHPPSSLSFSAVAKGLECGWSEAEMLQYLRDALGDAFNQILKPEWVTSASFPTQPISSISLSHAFSLTLTKCSSWFRPEAKDERLRVLTSSLPYINHRAGTHLLASRSQCQVGPP